MNSEGERDHLADELRKAIMESIQESTRIQEILGRMNQNGFRLNVWMMVGILLDERPEPILSKTKSATDLTSEDIEWLKSLKICLKDRV